MNLTMKMTQLNKSIADFFAIIPIDDAPQVIIDLGDAVALEWELSYSKLLIRDEVEDMDFSEMKTRLYSYLRANKRRLDCMYETLLTEYEPLSNYDKNSTITTTHGAQKDTSTHGAQSNTIQYGQTQTSTAFASATDTATNANMPMDGNEFLDTTKVTNVSGAHTDTTTGDAHSDVMSNQAYTDTLDKDSYVDKVIEHTQGNIGVTTSQQMATSELLLRNFDFIKYVAKVCADSLQTNAYDW